MLKNIAFMVAVLGSALYAEARITSLGEPARVGIAADPQHWHEINPHTWNVFTEFDGDKMLGVNAEHITTLTAECYSTGIMEGRKVGDFTAVASLTDRGEFFGGDGYLDLYYFAPVDMDRYAQQLVIFGGWKYNLTKYIDIDLGGNIIYATKRVVGPGLVVKGMGGETFSGDIYVAFSSDEVYISPFVLIGYDPTYDETKFMAGFSPKLDLSEILPIKGFSLETSCIFGYTRAQRFSGSEIATGGYWRNSYAYIQTEANLVYTFKHLRTFIGVGWAIHNDGETAPNGESLGGDNNVWVGGGIGWIF